MKALFSLLIALLILIAFYDYSANHRITLVGFQSSEANQAARIAIPYGKVAMSLVIMILGIVFGSLYERIRESPDQINPFKELMAAFRSAHLYKSILVAPLVFAGIYAASKTQPDAFVSALFAFQNGFFCHSVFLDKKSPRP